jgi:hypothetical protein
MEGPGGWVDPTKFTSGGQWTDDGGVAPDLAIGRSLTTKYLP